VVSLLDSLRIASHTRRTHIREFRYDLRDPSGQFVQRVWRTESIPIFNGDGALFCILHQAEDVTAREQRRDPDGAAA
jgi:PAS domain-containing protein